MNKKGFVVSSTVFIIMLVTTGAIFLAYSPLINSRNSIVQTKRYMVSQIEKRNALERMHGQILSGEALPSDIEFDDLGIDVVYEKESILVQEPIKTEVSTAPKPGSTASIDILFTSGTTVDLVVDFIDYGYHNNDMFSYVLTREGVKEPVQSGKNIKSQRYFTISLNEDSHVLGNYNLEVTGKFLTATIVASYSLVSTERDTLNFYKNGELIHTQYLN